MRPGDFAEQLAARTRVMLDAARAAGERSLEYFQGDRLGVDWKVDGTEVTVADREGERLVRSIIGGAFAGDAVTGEEEGSGGVPGAEWSWLIDPIDGTRSFARGVPLYSVLIGVFHRGASVAGVIELPALGERVHAAEGCGAWWERAGRAAVPARVGGCERLDRALVCTTSFDYYKRSGRLAELERLCHASGSVRGWSDAYLFALAATGRVDVAIDPVMQPWDNGPFPVIFREAGGVFTDWQGRPVVDGGDGVAANAALHGQVLSLLAGGGVAEPRGPRPM